MTPVKRASYSEGVGFNALGFLVVVVIGVGSGIVTARIYGVTTIGEYALAVAAANAVMVLSTLREGPAFLRRVGTLPARDPVMSGLWLSVMGLSMAVTTFVGVLLLALVWVLLNGPIDQPDLFEPAVVAVALYVVIDNTIQRLDIVFSMFRAGRQLFWMRATQTLLLAALAIGLGLVEPSVWMLIFAGGASSAVALGWRLAVLGRYLDVRPPRAAVAEGRAALPDLVRFGLKIVPGSMADGLTNQCGTWVLGSIAPIASVGAYNRANQLGRSLASFNPRITEMLLPTMVERQAKGDHAGFDRALVDTLRYASAGLFLVASAGGGAAAGIMDLYGDGFEEGAAALAWVLAVAALAAMSLVLRNALYAVNRPLRTTVSAFLRLALTAGATIPLTHAYGAAGPAIALCIGLVADILFTGSTVVRHLSTSLHVLWPPRQLAAMAVAGVTGFVVAEAIYDQIDAVPGLLLALVAGTATYLVVLLGGGWQPRDRQRALAAADKLRRR